MQFRLLGALEIIAGARRLMLTRRRERWLLAVLLLEVGRVVSSEQLVDLLWDDPPPAARRALHSHVARIRALLAGAGAEANGTALERRHGGYVLTTDPERVDAHRFRSLIRHAQATDDPAQRWPLLCRALDEWRGPVLDGDGAEGLRVRLCADLEELRLAAVESWAAAGLALGRHAELVPELARLTAQQPTRERLAELHMRALYAGGRQADALALYRQIRGWLTDELGLEPGPALRQLHDAILREEPVEPLDAGPRPAPRRSRPAVLAAPAQLPAAPSAFIGRLDALRELDELLEQAGPVAVITGTAGVGKTGLALHWAHRNADRFRDGQLFLNLRAYAADAPVHPTEALRRFLRALGVDDPEIPDDVDEAAALYRSHVAGRQMLIVLDNAASADQVRPLLPGTATCTALVTGRDRLNGLVANDGARLIDLDVLTTDEAHALLASLLGPHVVAAEPDAVAELVERCARLPLALRLAAANLISRAHPRIAEYVADLANGNPLTTLDVEGNEQAAVATAFDLSYAGLPPVAQRLFRLVSLVPGHDFGVPAAAALAGVRFADARRTLDRLSDAHLVAECRPGRYYMHDLLRSYAAAQLEASERAAAQRRLVDFYVDTAHEAYPLLLPRREEWPRDVVHPPVEPLRFDDRTAALDWHEQERENLVGVVRQAADRGWHAPTWQLASCLQAFFSIRRHWSDWLTVARAGLASARRLGDARAAIRLHNSLGVAHRQLRRYVEARRHFRTVLRLAGRIGYGRMVGAANLNLGGLCLMAGDAPAGEHYTRAALAEPGYGDNPTFAALCYQNLGCALLDMDRYAEAAEALTRALELTSALNDTRTASYVHHNLADVALRQHDVATARYHAERELHLNSEIGDPLRRAAALDILASCLARTDRAAARAHWESARAICQELSHPLGDVLRDWLDTFDRTTDPVTLATLDKALRSKARRCL